MGLLRHGIFSLGWWVSFVTGIGIFTTVYLTPLFLGRVRGFNAQIGIAMLSAGAIQLAAVRVYSVLANRVDLRSLMMFGLACFPMGLWSFTPITHDWGRSELLLPQAFRGFAQQFAVAPVVTLTLGGLPPERLATAKRPPWSGATALIDWLCWPRFDSAACFAALLGSTGNGR